MSPAAASVTRVLLIRHGQTVWNREERIRGQADIDLDEVGRQQAEATARAVAERWSLAAVYASPLKRTRQTAAPIARLQGCEAQPHPGLLDMSFGDLQGLNGDELLQRYPQVARAWIEEPHKVEFPAGESLAIVRQRAMAGLAEIVARHPAECVACVSHTVVNRVLLCAILGLGNDHFWRLGQETCAINVFDVQADVYTLQMLNDTCHLRHIVAAPA
jgi:phosphoserine phosphatase